MFNFFPLLFAIILIAYAWYSFSIIYHLIRFGIGKHPKVLALVFFFGSFLLFALFLFSYNRVDWKQMLEFLFHS